MIHHKASSPIVSISLIARCVLGVIVLFSDSANAEPVASVSSNGVTWQFAQPTETGNFVNGDPWVVGPVTIVAISNSLNSEDFTPKEGQNGSMLNPGGTDKQGYDSGLSSYDASLNAGRPTGKVLSAENPLILTTGSTLVSMVSWLFNSEADAEPGTPRFGGGGRGPRPATRAAGILTAVSEAPAEGSFRPAYAGSGKKVQFKFTDLDQSKLGKLAAVGSTPAIGQLEQAMEKTWVDHVSGWMGALVHPSEHMPDYGREIGQILVKVALVLQLDFDKISGEPSKDKLLVSFVQFGIDCSGIADAGGAWGADGGHGLGRKLPILFAGALLNDKHMLAVGTRDTRFQEDENTFYVTQAEIDITHSSEWIPDKRSTVAPYEEINLGMPEWGIRHEKYPQRDNCDWSATYRAINNSVHVGTALAARLMQVKEDWQHDAFFDYTDRVMQHSGRLQDNSVNSVPAFVVEMWQAYRGDDDQMALKSEWL